MWSLRVFCNVILYLMLEDSMVTSSSIRLAELPSGDDCQLHHMFYPTLRTFLHSPLGGTGLFHTTCGRRYFTNSQNNTETNFRFHAYKLTTDRLSMSLPPRLPLQPGPISVEDPHTLTMRMDDILHSSHRIPALFDHDCSELCASKAQPRPSGAPPPLPPVLVCRDSLAKMMERIPAPIRDDAEPRESWAQ